MHYYQQGDCLLKKIDSLPDGLSKTDDLVLQHGEVTNHKHRFDSNMTVQVYLGKSGDLNAGETIMPGRQKFVVVKDTAYLLHEEHKTIKVPPGIYEMDLVREYDYDKHETRRVVD